MATTHGDFIWYELLTTDVDAASAFYGAVVGWRVRAFENPAVDYRSFGLADADIAGLMAIPPEAAGAGMRPVWLGYIAVDDVDGAAARIVEAGGMQRMEPTDIPDVGRFAVVTDPQGAPFYIMRSTMERSTASFSPTQRGHCHWNELETSDEAGALRFYASQFGWEKGDAMPMGEMGDYQFITQRGATIGAVMRQQPGSPMPAWRYYFGVEDIDTAARAVTDNGGMVHYGPAEVPGGVFIVVASDPQGAMFGLVGARPH